MQFKTFLTATLLLSMSCNSGIAKEFLIRQFLKHFILVLADMCSLFLFNHKDSIIQIKYYRKMLKNNNNLFLLNKIYLNYGYLDSYLSEYFN